MISLLITMLECLREIRPNHWEDVTVLYFGEKGKRHLPPLQWVEWVTTTPPSEPGIWIQTRREQKELHS